MRSRLILILLAVGYGISLGTCQVAEAKKSSRGTPLFREKSNCASLEGSTVKLDEASKWVKVKFAGKLSDPPKNWECQAYWLKVAFDQFAPQIQDSIIARIDRLEFHDDSGMFRRDADLKTWREGNSTVLRLEFASTDAWRGSTPKYEAVGPKDIENFFKAVLLDQAEGYDPEKHKEYRKKYVEELNSQLQFVESKLEGRTATLASLRSYINRSKKLSEEEQKGCNDPCRISTSDAVCTAQDYAAIFPEQWTTYKETKKITKNLQDLSRKGLEVFEEYLTYQEGVLLCQEVYKVAKRIERKREQIALSFECVEQARGCVAARADIGEKEVLEEIETLKEKKGVLEHAIEFAESSGKSAGTKNDGDWVKTSKERPAK